MWRLLRHVCWDMSAESVGFYPHAGRYVLYPCTPLGAIPGSGMKFRVGMGMGMGTAKYPGIGYGYGYSSQNLYSTAGEWLTVTDNCSIASLILFETCLVVNFIPIFGYGRYGYGYRYLKNVGMGMGIWVWKKPGIPKIGMGMGIPEPGILGARPPLRLL